MKINFKSRVSCFILIVLGLIFGFFIESLTDRSCYSGKLKYINPDLVCEDKMVISKKGYFGLRTKIEEYIEEKKELKQCIVMMSHA